MGCSPSRVAQLSDPTVLDQKEVSSDESTEDIPHLKQKINLFSPITCMDISDDSSMLVLGTEDGVLHVFSTMSTPVEALVQLRGHSESVTCCRIHGQCIFSGSTDCFIIKWSIVTMRMTYVYRGHGCKINSIICAGNFLFSSSYDRTARAWRTHAPNLPNHEQLNRKGKVSATAKFDIDSSPRTTNCNRDPLTVCTFRGHEKGVYPLAFIPADDRFDLNYVLRDADLLVTGSADCTARIWSTSTAECRHVLTGHKSPIHAITINFENEEKTIFTAGGDGLIICFCSITGDRLRSLYGHEAAILRFDRHKNMLFSASADRTARAWVMEFGEDMRVFRESRTPVTCVRYFRGFVTTGSEDGSCRIYDSKSGSLMRTLRDEELSPVIDLWNVAGKVLSAHQNGRLLVWDSSGIRDETVFGEEEHFSGGEEEANSGDDSSDVIEAVHILEKYLGQR